MIVGHRESQEPQALCAAKIVSCKPVPLPASNRQQQTEPAVGERFFFAVEVVTLRSSWIVHKRYTCFTRLYHALKASPTITAPVQAVPPPSPREACSTLEAAVLSVQRVLNAWLGELVSRTDLNQSVIFRQFLETNASSFRMLQQSMGVGLPAGRPSSSSSILRTLQQMGDVAAPMGSPPMTYGGPASMEVDDYDYRPSQEDADMGTGNGDSRSGRNSAAAADDDDEPRFRPPSVMSVGIGSMMGQHSRENSGGSGPASSSRRLPSIDDFVLVKCVGKGSFGKVILVQRRGSGKVYAMKVLAKEHVIKRNQVEHTNTERSILGYISHPFIVALRYAFQSKRKLYFILDFMPGGELFYHLGLAGRFPEERARFYAAQMVLALEYLHSLNIVYRDLKPENVLLDADGYIALTDFGLSKEGIEDNTSAHSFCGTPEYLAPEILTRVGHGKAADWWSLGALLYEMLTGMPPFYSRNRDRLFRKILKAPLRIPRHFSIEATAILTRLLNRDPRERLCRPADIKAHPFFRGVDWDALLLRRVDPPFRPEIRNDLTSNFDAEFTQMPLDSVETRSGFLSPSVSNGQFQNFTFVGQSMSSGVAPMQDE